MIRRGVDFPAEYVVDRGDVSQADFVIGASDEVGRAVLVTPLGDDPAWTAALAAPKPLLRAACSGEFASPCPEVVLLAERGTVFWVEVGHPADYRVIRTEGPVVQVEPVVAEGLVLLVTPWSLTAVSQSGVAWSTTRIAIEGLRVDEVADGWLRGVADPRDEEPRDFAVDLATGEVVGGVDLS